MDKKRKAVSGRFDRLLKRVKALEEEIVLAITSPDDDEDKEEAEMAAEEDEAASQREGSSSRDEESGNTLIQDGTAAYLFFPDNKENDPPGKTAEETAIAPQLDEETLNILGEDPSAKVEDLMFPAELTVRWEKWLKSGISKETKMEILEKYSRQGNIQLEASQLNEELMALLNDAAVRRDKHFMATQNLAGTALSSLGSALVKVMFAEEHPTDRLALLTELSDTAKLLTEIHHGQSKARISYILPSVSKEFRAILEKTTPDKFLFGTDLGERIRDAKAVARIGKDFEKEQPKSGSVNSRGLTSKPGNARSGQNQKSTGKSQQGSKNMSWSQKSTNQGRAGNKYQQKNANRGDRHRK